MDGWIEVLIIGKVVGWSGGVPKGLPSGSGAALVGGLRSLFFSTYFREGLRSVFFRFFVHFGRFWEAETEAKIDFSAVFCLMLFSSAHLHRFWAGFWSLGT